MSAIRCSDWSFSAFQQSQLRRFFCLFQVNAKDIYENTALHEAANYERVAAVEMLLKNGADTKSLNEDAKTPLDLAKQWNSEKYRRIVDILKAYE